MAKKPNESSQNLVIVESPAKAKTIEKFLGSEYLVKSSLGHVRDLEKKGFGIDMKNNYTPLYVVLPEKSNVIKDLKQFSKKADTVWLASDEDREGESIAWHLSEVLGLDMKKTKRIVFHEITKEAILKAIQNPRQINIDLVDAQQARRVLDRLVGYELSPVLWKKVKPALSAGRVQSVAVRLIVEKEREIYAFDSESSFKTNAIFIVENIKDKANSLKAELNYRFKTSKEVLAFLQSCTKADFKVENIVKKPYTKTPAAPFTTSTLQQEASRKLGFSVSQTMSVAQKLYESGKITYMRTDSVNLADSAIGQAVNQIKNEMGDKYVKVRKYKTTSKGAQEAHEAIRPTNLNNPKISGTNTEQRLYDLIYKRTLASQMADALIEKTTVTINISNSDKKFIATGEVIKFDGFLRVYSESTDVEKEDDDAVSLLPPVKENDKLGLDIMESRERWNQKPWRYSEASLVRKLEELGIGRPSTYAPTISTIQQRGYVIKTDRAGTPRKYQYLKLQKGKITQEEKSEITGAERSKLFPEDIGMVVNDFLVQHFPDVVSYDFTANVEKEFDDIADGKLNWQKSIDRFYVPFHKHVEKIIETSDRNTGERLLGNDPKTGKPVIVRIGRFGPMAQIGKSSDNEKEKPAFASLAKDQHLETITLEEALKLFQLPREVGMYENKKVVVGIGRFGPYVRHDQKFASLKKGIDDPLEITLERAIELIEEKNEKDNKKIIKTFNEMSELTILSGKYGPYVSFKGNNFTVPKSQNPSMLSLEDALKIVSEGEKKKASKSKIEKVSATVKKSEPKKKVVVRKKTTKK
ncbi:MAG: type I DNA topoisomerase [Marinilabiliaceae bacterium]|nr:type I DNA topoisomerase [Marinilabiliaceae bacterium]